MTVRIEQSWKEALQSEFDKPYFSELAARLHAEKAEKLDSVGHRQLGHHDQHGRPGGT